MAAVHVSVCWYTVKTQKKRNKNKPFCIYNLLKIDPPVAYYFYVLRFYSFLPFSNMIT